ncbi:MAG: hypothetical protein GY710_03575 [Desulfobacteraceae bacterium]|nr:hypothetical protein [Desulfobacteraceae bacterium]
MNNIIYDQLLAKQRRSIRRDISLIFSLKGLSFPKTFAEVEEIGYFSPKVTINNKEIYLTKDGIIALRRICDFISQTKEYKDYLSYNDIFQEVIAEIERWMTDKLIPDEAEFLAPLELLISKKIDKFTFFCRVDGISIEKFDSFIKFLDPHIFREGLVPDAVQKWFWCIWKDPLNLTNF